MVLVFFLPQTKMLYAASWKNNYVQCSSRLANRVHESSTPAAGNVILIALK